MGSKASGLLVASLVTACTVGPNYQKPAVPTPTRWQATDNQNIVPTEDANQLTKWWTLFGDDTLTELVARARTQGFDVRTAAARIAAARAERRGVAAGSGPKLQGEIGASRQENPFPGLAEGIKFSLYEIGFDAQWEIDLFGRQRRRLEAADATLQATMDERQAVLASLSAEVARGYWALRSLDAQLLIVDNTVHVLRETLRLTEKLVAAGVGTKHDMLRARAAVATAAANVPNLRAARVVAERQLELLLALPPGELTARLHATAASDTRPTPQILLSPAAVIRSRPDIQRAERLLAAATALKGAAIADLYPSISLGAFFGLRNTGLDSLFATAAESWMMGGKLLAPLFDGGSRHAAVDRSDAQIDAALADYEKTVLTALHETEIALTRLVEEERRRAGLTLAVADLREAAHLAHRRYESGVASFLEVLDAERELARSELDLAVSKGTIATDTVAVFKALGGGVEIAVQTASASGPITATTSHKLR